MRRLLPGRAAWLVVVAALAILPAACGGGDQESSGSGTATPRVSRSARAGSPTPAVTAAATPPPGTQGSGAQPTPTRRPGVIGPTEPPREDQPLYIALGDSLSAGVGASDFNGTAFVPLVHQALGPGVGLMNLGHSGDTSGQLIRHGHLDQAIGEIQRRNADGIAGNEVVLVTLEIGGNDLLDLYFDLVVPGTCPTIEESLQRPECVNELRAALDNYVPNLDETVRRLREADGDLAIVLLTLYNPFSGKPGPLEDIGILALEGMSDTAFPDGLNDLIRTEAAESGVSLADVYPLFVGKGYEYISQDLIHPNDVGYRVMADAVLAAVGR